MMTIQPPRKPVQDKDVKPSKTARGSSLQKKSDSTMNQTSPECSHDKDAKSHKMKGEHCQSSSAQDTHEKSDKERQGEQTKVSKKGDKVAMSSPSKTMMQTGKSSKKRSLRSKGNFSKSGKQSIHNEDVKALKKSNKKRKESQATDASGHSASKQEIAGPKHKPTVSFKGDEFQSDVKESEEESPSSMTKAAKEETKYNHITDETNLVKAEHIPEDDVGPSQKHSEGSTTIKLSSQSNNVEIYKEKEARQLTLDMIDMGKGKKKGGLESPTENPSNKEQLIQKFKEVFGIEPSETESCNRLAQCWNDENELEKFIKDHWGSLHGSVEFMPAKSSENKVTIKEGFPYVIIGKTQSNEFLPEDTLTRTSQMMQRTREENIVVSGHLKSFSNLLMLRSDFFAEYEPALWLYEVHQLQLMNLKRKEFTWKFNDLSSSWLVFDKWFDDLKKVHDKVAQECPNLQMESILKAHRNFDHSKHWQVVGHLDLKKDKNLQLNTGNIDDMQNSQDEKHDQDSNSQSSSNGRKRKRTPQSDIQGSTTKRMKTEHQESHHVPAEGSHPARNYYEAGQTKVHGNPLPPVLQIHCDVAMEAYHQRVGKDNSINSFHFMFPASTESTRTREKVSVFRSCASRSLLYCPTTYFSCLQITREIIARHESDKLTGILVRKVLLELGQDRTENLPKLQHSFYPMSVLLKDVFCYLLKCCGFAYIENPLTKLYSQKVGKFAEGKLKGLHTLFDFRFSEPYHISTRGLCARQDAINIVALFSPASLSCPKSPLFIINIVPGGIYPSDFHLGIILTQVEDALTIDLRDNIVDMFVLACAILGISGTFDWAEHKPNIRNHRLVSWINGTSAVTSCNPFTAQYRRGYVDFEQFPSIMKFLNQSDYQDLVLLLNAEGDCRDIDDEELREVVMILTFKSLSEMHREIFMRSLATYICSGGFKNPMSHLEKFRSILQSEWSKAEDFTRKFKRVLTKLPTELLQKANKILKTNLKASNDKEWFGDKPGMHPIPARAPKEVQSQSQDDVDLKKGEKHEANVLNKESPLKHSELNENNPGDGHQSSHSEGEEGSENSDDESDQDQDNEFNG